MSGSKPKVVADFGKSDLCQVLPFTVTRPVTIQEIPGSRVEESVSVEIEEVKPRDWAENVYQPDVVNNSEKLYKKLGYTM